MENMEDWTWKVYEGDPPETLGDLVFGDALEKAGFLDILKTMDGISPVFVERSIYDSKKWDIIKSTWSWTYNMYLPEDLKISELPAIIYRVNKLTFGDAMPVYASIYELKVKIVIAVDILLKNYTHDDTEKKRAIKKYVRLYEQMFPGESASLSNAQRRNEIITSNKNKRFKAYEKKLLKTKINVDLCDLKDGMIEKISYTDPWAIEEVVAQALEQHLVESFFERGVNNLRIWLKTITEAELAVIETKKWKIKIRDRDVDKEERFLRDALWIDVYKQALEKLRKLWD